MNERRDTLRAIGEMEEDVYDVLRHALALSYIAASPHMIEPECLTALSDPLEQIGKRLRERFKLAHAAAVGDR